MIPRQLPRKPPSLSPFHFHTHFHVPRPPRFQSSSSSTSPPGGTQARSRATRILDRLPRSLRPYATRLQDAPLSHVISFLVLHELTAVVPLVGLAGLFHWGGGVGLLFSDTSYLAPGIEKFERYFRRKGWFGLGEKEGEGDDDRGAGGAGIGAAGGDEGEGHTEEQAQEQKWNLDSPGMHIVVEVAAAYAVTKALLPLRLMLSVWATPWFARVIVGRVWGGITSLGRAEKGSRTGTAVASGTGVVRKAAKRTGKDIPKI